MPINWQDPEVKDRLLASIIASFDGKINCQEVARVFGEGATYNSIENFLRKPKRLAIELKNKAAGRSAPPSPAKPKTPKKDGVKSGRVTKPQKNSANGSFSGSPVKKEIVWGDENFLNGGGPDVDAEVTLDSDEYA